MPISTLPGINVRELRSNPRTPPDKLWWTDDKEHIEELLIKSHIQRALLSSHKLVNCPVHGHVVCFIHEKKCPIRKENNGRSGWHWCNQQLTWKELTT